MRRLKLALLAVGAVAIPVGGYFGIGAIERSFAKRDASAAYARFARCVYGDGAGPPSERVRFIELGVASRRESAPDPGDANWPARCAPHARKLSETWTRLAGLGGDANVAMETSRTILAPLAVVADDLSRGELADRHAPALDAIASRASVDLAPRPDDAKDVPAPPAPAVPMKIKGAVTPIYRDEGLLTDVAPVSGRSIDAQFAGKDEVCVFGGDPDPAKTLGRVRCVRIHANVPRGTSRRLVAHDDAAAPLLAVFDYAVGGVYSATTGERLLAAGTSTVEGAFGRADGFVATLDRTIAKDGAFADAYTLARRLANGTTSRAQLDRPRFVKDRVFDAHVVADAIVWLEGAYGAEQEMFARAILDGDAPVGPIVSVGKVPANVAIGERAAACRTRDALFVGVSSDDVHVLAVRSGDRWRALPTPAGTRGRLTCRGAEAVYTSARPGGVGTRDLYEKGPLEIVQTRCTIDRCEQSIARVASITTTREAIDGNNAKLAVTDVAGSVALAWLGAAVFLRVAPLREIERAPVRVLVDTSGSDVLLVHGMNLPTRQDAAVLLLNTSEGAIPLRVDASGAVTPVVVDR